MAGLAVADASAPVSAAGNAMIAFRLDLPALSSPLLPGPLSDEYYRLARLDGVYGLTDDGDLVPAVDVDVARVIDGYAHAAFGGLFQFSGAARAPYLAQVHGFAYSGVRLMLRDGLRFSFGQAFTQAGHNPFLADSQGLMWGLSGGVPFDPRDTATALAGLSWDFAAWGNLSLTAAQTEDRNGLPALPKSKTTALGVAARVGLGGGWITTLSYAQATAQLRLNTGSPTDGNMRSQSYGIAVAKQGLFGKDALGLSLTRPATGGYTAGSLSGEVQQFQFYGRDKLFAGLMPETDIEVGYVTNFLDRSVALDVNAAYQMNYKGQNKDEVSFISRAKIKF